MVRPRVTCAAFLSRFKAFEFFRRERTSKIPHFCDPRIPELEFRSLRSGIEHSYWTFEACSVYDERNTELLSDAGRICFYFVSVQLGSLSILNLIVTLIMLRKIHVFYSAMGMDSTDLGFNTSNPDVAPGLALEQISRRANEKVEPITLPQQIPIGLGEVSDPRKVFPTFR